MNPPIINLGPPPNQHYEVKPEQAGWRLDQFLTLCFAPQSRSSIQNWLKKSCVIKNCVIKGNNVIKDCHYKVKPGEVYSVTPPTPAELTITPQEIDFTIVFEDKDLLVINKPAGLVVHPSPGHFDKTLVNGLLAHCRDSLSGIGGVRRPGIVHRLDKDTSGLMVVAKNDLTHHHLAKQFEPKILSTDRERSLKRTYLGVVWGCPQKQKGVIEANIQRHPNNRQKMSVVMGGRGGSVEGSALDSLGRFARTNYKVEKTIEFAKSVKNMPNNKFMVSLVSYELDTGRTHQIRVHSQFAGFPLVGDPVYGTSIGATLRKYLPECFLQFNRQALHAVELKFIHPTTKEYMRFSAPPPKDLQQLLDFINNFSPLGQI